MDRARPVIRSSDPVELVRGSEACRLVSVD